MLYEDFDLSPYFGLSDLFANQVLHFLLSALRLCNIWPIRFDVDMIGHNQQVDHNSHAHYQIEFISGSGAVPVN